MLNNDIYTSTSIGPFLENDLYSAQLEYARCKVHNSDILHDAFQAFHKFQMSRILLQVVLSVLLVLEIHHKAMGEATLVIGISAC